MPFFYSPRIPTLSFRAKSRNLVETNAEVYSSRLALSKVAGCFAILFYTLGFPKVAGKLASVARLKRIVVIASTKAIFFI